MWEAACGQGILNETDGVKFQEMAECMAANACTA